MLVWFYSRGKTRWEETAEAVIVPEKSIRHEHPEGPTFVLRFKNN